ncbi:MAG: mercuric transport protein [Rhodanobacter sp. SCN 65-17]|jgi:mercuric ion transport protein|uniref:mercuric ion transporter MerT n=1 Tax=Rhodanobacter sp. PCA2 TaxID=2006117 RepID=UPI00086B796B|nr:mercuric ion transporter MerT [Rhodanobacter sp. PCA2]MBA2079437.1 mercuric transport protein [Rhodanobacter sp. PCA2]ODU66823.1 MAG: mercuric transport protein [Rhodanobacter sp. SCN 65-17]
MQKPSAEKSTLAIGGLAAMLASACCLGPLILVSIGLSGAWIGQLTRLEPLRPWFLLVSLIALGSAYWRIYRRPPACLPGEMCASPAIRRVYKALFLLVVALIAVAFAFPYAAPLFY